MSSLVDGLSSYTPLVSVRFCSFVLRRRAFHVFPSILGPAGENKSEVETEGKWRRRDEKSRRKTGVHRPKAWIEEEGEAEVLDDGVGKVGVKEGMRRRRPVRKGRCDPGQTDAA
jgi:hypothetical protein